MYGNRAKPFFTDTESLIYEIETEDFYKSISNNVEARLDTINFPKDHPSDIPMGCNKVMWMMTDEASGKIIEEFSDWEQLYSYEIFEEKEEKKV